MTQQRQAARDDPGITTVLPGSADQHDAIETVVEHLADGVGRPTPCVLHQHQADDPELVDSLAIDLA